MAMSRKHYRQAADIFKAQVDDAAKLPEELQAFVMTTITEMAKEFARMFKGDNGAFQAQTFYTACGLDASKIGW